MTNTCENCYYSSNLRHLNPWVFVTYNCSCRCEYCMIPKMDSSDMNMSSETFKKILEITEKLIEAGEYARAFFRVGGGEPFLVFDTYKDIITEYKKRYPEQMQFGILTNFVNFNDEIADWMEMNNIGMQVSLDDLEYSKPLVNGQPSAEKVLNNILKLMSRNIGFSFNTVLDINKTKDLTKLANFVSSFRNIDWGLNASYTENDPSKINEVIKIFDDCIFQLVRRNFDIYNKLRFYNSIVGRGQGGCTTGVNSFAIGTNLEVWSCQSLIDKEKLGYFDENITQTLITAPGNEYFRERRMRRECPDCPVLGVCRGGCRATHESDEINNVVCEIRKNILGKLMSGYYTKNNQGNNCNCNGQCNENSTNDNGLDNIISNYISNLTEMKEAAIVPTPEMNLD